MRGVIHVAPDTSAANCNGARRGIDLRVLDRRKINNQTVVTNSQTARIVAAAADGNQQIVISAKID